MTQYIHIIGFIILFGIFLLQFSGSVWLAKKFKVFFPLFLVLAIGLSSISRSVFSDESSTIFYKMTDEVGIGVEIAVFRINLMWAFSTLFASISILLISLVAFTEILKLIQKSCIVPVGFWTSLTLKNKNIVRLGIVSVAFRLVSASAIGVYYYLI